MVSKLETGWGLVVYWTTRYDQTQKSKIYALISEKRRSCDIGFAVGQVLVHAFEASGRLLGCHSRCGDQCYPLS